MLPRHVIPSIVPLVPSLSAISGQSASRSHVLLIQSRRHYACQIHYPTKLGQLRHKLRGFGQGHIELDLNHSPGLALLTLSNPEKHNALTGKMMAELADCIDFLDEATSNTTSLPELNPESALVLKSRGISLKKVDQEQKNILDGLVGVIVTGAGQKSFCAGLDLSAAKKTLLTSQAGSEMSALMVSTLTRFLRLPLMTMAAIEKAAIGGGAEMTTWCDHRCLADQAKIQFVQTQMGVVTGWGGASRLLNIVPRSTALRLLGAATPIKGGQEAVRIGFAQVAAPAGGSALATATEFMQDYVWEKRPDSNQEGGARRCVKAVRSFKKIVSLGTDHDNIERVSELEKDLFKELWGGPDNLARVEAASSKKS